MRIWAWGANTNGQLGLGHISEQESTPQEVKYSFPSFDKYYAVPFAIVGGASRTLCLVEFRRRVDCPQQQMDDDDEYEEGKELPTFLKVTDTFHILRVPHARGVSAGFDSYFYMEFETGIVKSSGDNSHDQLGRRIGSEENQKKSNGNGSSSSSSWTWDWDKVNLSEHNRPVPHFASISAGLRHVAAISTHQNLYVWGDNSKFQIGIFETTPEGEEMFETRVSYPKKLEFPPGFRFTKVACGKDFTIVVHDSGRLFGCGQNTKGVLLHAPQDIKHYKKFTHIFDYLSNEAEIRDIRAGWSHVIVLLTNGKVISWGRNDFGQLGRPSVNPKFDVEPGYVQFPEKIVSIRSATEHNLALGDSGKVYAWGWNEHDNCGVRRTFVPPDGLMANINNQLPKDEKVDEERNSREDCIFLPTLVPFPEDVIVSAIGCGAGSSFALST